MPAPKAPADAVAILARNTHRELVRYLVDNPGSYYGDIKDGIGAPISTLTRDLRQLEEIGVVRPDVEQPIGSRRGRAPRYTVDTDRVRLLVDGLRESLLG